MSPNDRDLLAQTFAVMLDQLADELAPKVASRLPSATGTATRTAPLPDVPEREFLVQREAAEWTGISVSGLRRARKNGLPWTMALGQVTYRLSDLRDLMNGRYND
ncbi:hypothetical protein B1759_16630 [Rubrivirga sp. SAORIC476]|uniref:hypothetical protein n=1 Tax=Rubrivirga sp. SAORIC476 TaxID=1961794 RepID=UPI000BA9611E|nr:hypothetical protein [Rubrivirga sp. SAORIC476]PAP74803.1 hypothetical protein B1759_16630 [Rubrivirga sp. SAORIC476]